MLPVFSDYEYIFFKILFIHERHSERGRGAETQVEGEEKRERGRDIGRGRSRLHAGSLTWDSILGLQD